MLGFFKKNNKKPIEEFKDTLTSFQKTMESNEKEKVLLESK